jgi:hypothetical protein
VESCVYNAQIQGRVDELALRKLADDDRLPDAFRGRRYPQMLDQRCGRSLGEPPPLVDDSAAAEQALTSAIDLEESATPT